MEKRLTFHSGYRDKNGKAYNVKHNQRESFSKPKKAENVYWDYGKKLGGTTFSENEKLFYEKFFGKHVKRHNAKCKERRQYSRMQTMAQYKEKHPPEETILYIGTENVNPETLGAIFNDFRKFLMTECNDAKKKCGVMPLNAAMHLDETTPHIHFRQVYYYCDKDGCLQISQNKALEGLGISRPDPTGKSGKFNNAKMTFTALCREKLFEIARSYGVELETEPRPKDQSGLSIDEFRAREQARETWAKEQEQAQADLARTREQVGDLKERDHYLRLCAEKQNVRESAQNEREWALDKREEKLCADEQKARKTQNKASAMIVEYEGLVQQISNDAQEIKEHYQDIERRYRDLGEREKARETQDQLQDVKEKANEVEIQATVQARKMENNGYYRDLLKKHLEDQDEDDVLSAEEAIAWLMKD